MHVIFPFANLIIPHQMKTSDTSVPATHYT